MGFWRAALGPRFARAAGIFYYTTPQPFCQEILRKFLFKIFFLKVLTFAGGRGIIYLPKGGKKEKSQAKKN
jgi:hypothetical protein